jgi:membrane protein implicated in regulation of membrane protease activity
MSRPVLALSALLVLWLIVVVPMVLRRHDERAQDRSVRRFGRRMRALNRRAAASGALVEPDAVRFVQPRITAARDEVFVAMRSHDDPRPAARRPTPAAEEALMYPVDRHEMSAARRRMMTRRRRSLALLGGGSLIMVPVAFTLGGAGLWAVATVFLIGLAGYVYFLRSQALRDRERRSMRQQRFAERRPRGYDVTAQSPFFAEPDPTVVRIDDDDVLLQNLDTVDLTGLYNDQDHDAVAAQRRAS